ncbi:MAG TPA: efflux RND transporter periplasmic adaptor subunit [Gemmataceae bacterium]|nr:efflux RND transporter periplasmic adaptor subunit [Gemmataceae bacterium]
MDQLPLHGTTSDASAGHVQPPVRNRGARNRFVWLGRTALSLLVFAALGVLFVWGHHTGWKLPRFSSLAGDTLETKDDWCEAHGVPESQCVECNPDLMPRTKPFGWCKVHGVHECPLDHPEVAQTPVSPRIAGADFARANRALEFAERLENNTKCKLHDRRIQFASMEAVDKAGIEVEPVWTAAMVESVAGNGEITYDQTRTARLSSRVPGTVFQVTKRAGDTVKQGEVIALVDAAEVGKAKSEFLQAMLQVRLGGERLQRLEEALGRGAVSEQAYREQVTAVSESRIRLATAREAMVNLGLSVDLDAFQAVPKEKLADRLRFLGLPESTTRSLDPHETTGNLLAVTAPFDGVVVARHVVGGEVVDSTKLLFVVVDVRQMWLTLDLRLEDAARVSVGQEVRFRPDSGAEARGKISWISTEADPKTRTLKVRATLDNGDGRLRANTFGSGRVVLREESQAVVVPNSAVHWEGCCHVVFVRDKRFLESGAPKVFHVRTVRLGANDDKQTEIIAGVLPGEIVATRGSGLLRSELLKNDLGEG